MSNLRILLLSSFYPPDIGGAQRQTQLLGQELARRGHSIAIGTIWQAGLAERELDGAVPVRRLKGLTNRVPWFSVEARRRRHPPFPDPLVVFGLRRLLAEFKPDVLHSYGWISYSAAAALIGKRIPLILSARTYGYTCAITSMLHRGQVCSGPAPAKCFACAASRYGSAAKGAASVAGVQSGKLLLRRKVAGVHTISTFVQQTIRRDLIGGRPIDSALIPSFREGEEPEGQASDLAGRLPAQPFILFVGALTPHKGLDILLAAYRRLAEPPPLVLIGTVRGDTDLQLPPNVQVFYNIPHPAVMQAWQRCLFGVAPSLWPEPFGSVVHEAMSKGKAMIGTYPGGHTDMIVDGESGLLVPAGDLPALAAAMQRLIDSPELRERLGAAARAHAGIYTAEVMVPRFEAFYEQVVRPAAGQPSAPEPQADSLGGPLPPPR